PSSGPGTAARREAAGVPAQGAWGARRRRRCATGESPQRTGGRPCALRRRRTSSRAPRGPAAPRPAPGSCCSVQRWWGRAGARGEQALASTSVRAEPRAARLETGRHHPEGRLGHGEVLRAGVQAAVASGGGRRAVLLAAHVAEAIGDVEAGDGGGAAVRG